MKTISLLLLMCCAATLSAQELSPTQVRSTAAMLVKKQILTEKGKKILLNEFETNNIEVEHPSTVYDTTYIKAEQSKQAILVFLTRAFGSGLLHRQYDKKNSIENKIRQEDKLLPANVYATMVLGLGGYQYQDCIHPKRSTIGATRTRTLNDVYAIGLIDEKIYEEAKKQLRWELVTNEYELFRFLTSRSIHYHYYNFNKNEQEKYIKRLADAGILKKETLPVILNEYRDFKLLTIPQILEHSHRYVMTDLNKVENNPSLTYSFIFKKLKTILPGFQYSGLNVELKETPEGELIRQELQLGFIIEGKQYVHSFYHNYRKEHYGPNDEKLPEPKVDENFHKGINQWLANTGSGYRLYTIRYFNEESNQYHNDKIGLLLLKEGEALLVSDQRYLISEEQF